EMVMHGEARFLKEKFGERYVEWAENTPAFFPKFHNYHAPDRPFNWKRVLTQERNGLFALFSIYSFLNVFGEFMQNGTNYNYFLVTMTLLTGFGCLVLWYINQKTALLGD